MDLYITPLSARVRYTVKFNVIDQRSMCVLAVLTKTGRYESRYIMILFLIYRYFHTSYIHIIIFFENGVKKNQYQKFVVLI